MGINFNLHITFHLQTSMKLTENRRPSRQQASTVLQYSLVVACVVVQCAWAPYCLAIIRTFFVVAELARSAPVSSMFEAPAPYNATPLSSMTCEHQDTSLCP